MATDPKLLMCTGRYQDLARNGLGGSVDSPCSNNLGFQVYCNQPDVDAWTATAWDLWKRVRAKWNDTFAVVTIPPEIVDYITSLEKDYCTAGSDGQCETYLLPESSWYNINWNAQAAATISKWCARAACALELLDNARGIEGPKEQTQENTDVASDVVENVGDAIGGIGGAIGEVGKGVGKAVGGVGTAISWLPVIVLSGMGLALAGGIVYLRNQSMIMQDFQRRNQAALTPRNRNG